MVNLINRLITMTGLFLVLLTACTDKLPEPDGFFTHGPLLGRLGSDHIGVWARTASPDTFLVLYGTDPDKLQHASSPAETKPAHDNTGWILLQGLEPATRYYYQLVSANQPALAGPRGSFRTLPDPELLISPEENPEGLFNFSFEFGCGNQQARGTGEFDHPTYGTMLNEIKDEVDFAILNGDWLYEEKRDYPPDKWQVEIGWRETALPSIVASAPFITGVWENYKLYLSRYNSLSEWHRFVPSFFTMDDHELLDDIRGTGLTGYRNRRAVFRDIGTRAFYDYLGWSNPVESTQPVYFGLASLEEGSDRLYDPGADFAELDFDQVSNLHIHWRGPDSWQKEKHYDTLSPTEENLNAGVYEVMEVLDEKHLIISPEALSTDIVPYSLGRLNYFRKRIANCDFLFLDTRSHRGLPIQALPDQQGQSLLGNEQKEWVKSTMRNSNADFFFVLSSVNLVIPHPLDMGEVGAEQWTGQHDSWTGYPQELDEMLEFWDSLASPVLVLTGDIHNSFAIKVRDNIWEFASGPHMSSNAGMSSEGDRPASGNYQNQGREVDIHWSTYKRRDARAYRQPVYCVVQVNKVFNNPVERDVERWVKFPASQVIFRFYDGFTGKLMYAESVIRQNSSEQP